MTDIGACRPALTCPEYRRASPGGEPPEGRVQVRVDSYLGRFCGTQRDGTPIAKEPLTCWNAAPFCASDEPRNPTSATFTRWKSKVQSLQRPPEKAKRRFDAVRPADIKAWKETMGVMIHAG